ncbi:MAG: IPTL-CTERM sorting domain-containing protein [Halioglobus sp.]
MTRTTTHKLKGALTGFTAAATLALASTSAMAQTIDTGYFVTFELVGGAQGGYIFDAGFADIAKLSASVSGSSIVLAPNFSLYDENPGDAFWRDNGGAGPGGNKWMNMLGFEETNLTYPFAETETTLLGCASNNTLAAPYETVAFIKVFDPGFGLLDEQYQAVGSGNISLSADLSGYGGDVIVQSGFSTNGPNANPADAAALGSVSVSLGAVCAAPPPSAGGSTNAIPVLPLWGLLGLTALMGMFGARKLSKRG